MEPKTILIATSNKQKLNEIVHELADLPFNFIDLKKAGLDQEECPETGATLQENAYIKALFYGRKSGLLTIADDTGFFVKYLNGAPGIKAKRFASSPEECRKKIISALTGVKKTSRQAYFETAGCIFNPSNNSAAILTGKADGFVAEKEIGNAPAGVIYDSIFYYPPAKKTFAEMTVSEKNLVSHRGNVVQQIRYFLIRNYQPIQFIVPLAMVAHNRRLLLLKRRDHRADFNNKWEFPGGGVEAGEKVEDCLKREVLEETGLKIKIVEQLPKIFSHFSGEAKGNYQVHMVNFICTVKSGTLKTRAAETAGHKWATFKETLTLPLLPLNKDIIKYSKLVLKKYID